MNQHELLAILTRGEDEGAFINISPSGVTHWQLFCLQQTTLLINVLHFFLCHYLAPVGFFLEPKDKYPTKARLVLE